MALLLLAGISTHALRMPTPRLASLVTFQRQQPDRAGIRFISAAADVPIEEEIKVTIAATKVVVYSKSWCPFCQKTKALFDGLGVPYTAVELDERDDGAEVQEALLGITGQRTVPNVFVGGKHLGGNDDTQRAAKSGALQDMLK